MMALDTHGSLVWESGQDGLVLSLYREGETGLRGRAHSGKATRPVCDGGRTRQSHVQGLERTGLGSSPILRCSYFFTLVGKASRGSSPGPRRREKHGLGSHRDLRVEF